MNHKFYLKSKQEQNRFQIKIALIALGVNIPFLVLAYLVGNFFIALFPFAITLSIIAPFFDTPSLKASGSLIYHSPLFLAEKEKNRIIKVHGGTLFEYHFVLDRSYSGNQRTNLILHLYLKGILNLIDSLKFHKGESLKIKGTSYILNERTAKKIGFRVVKTDPVQKFILIYNYFNLLSSISIAKKNLAFPTSTALRVLRGT